MDSVPSDSTSLNATESFLTELSDLSRKYGIAINEQGVLFMMEPIDIQLTYVIDESGNLMFA